MIFLVLELLLLLRFDVMDLSKTILARSGNLLISCLTGVSFTLCVVMWRCLMASLHLSLWRMRRITSWFPREMASDMGLLSLRLTAVRSAP